ncbi:DNA topoisomerase 3 [Anaerotignum lactatifermentans]|uniref:DNA topoisomerase n=1 Tax=Anaerotignum lactatifermentans DSM 14214 TaxID=1121323 RepID=A0A1M6Y7Y6_9FIRM|nr:DNA topoisomerase 3 [Anaerotignum lactatifermentans]SHL14394.1 DNA topoisomerase-3 [[Clostridium] lactatifermentans DSM 14214] [Anaerotignum lactatifermentans DSM 14214]
MSETLVIAEKPSVAATIAAALGATEKKDGYIKGNGYLVSWCVGHLVQLTEAAAYGEQYKKWSYDSLPILPQEWQYTVAADKGKQFKILKDLMHRADVSEVVNACDAGREGELIFRFVYEVAGCKKPMRRLWISSMEESAIKAGFASLKDGKVYDSLYSSALCRAKADWIVGINMTRLFSCLYGKTLNVGRVQTPTLKMLVDRDAAITTFRKEKYYHVRLSLSGVEAASAKIHAAEDAAALKAACEASQAACVSIIHEKKTIAPPKLFDLTSLQREANRIYGYTAKQTLDLAQALYEKKLLTYPRTDSSYLTDDMGDTAAGIATLLGGTLPFMQGAAFTPEISRLLDSKKVSDHHAIIPTMELEKADLAALPESERNILVLVGARLLMACAEPHIFEAVTAVLSCAGQEFTAKGKTVLAAGWKDLERRFMATLKKKTDTEDDEENALSLDVPPFTEGQTFDNPQAAVTEHFTTPPKPHNEASLLSAMERAGNEETDPDAERRGLGTPATRAAIIEKLVKGGFVERKGKQLIPTKSGTELVCVLPDVLTSPKLTADWENNLTQIAKGQADPDSFMTGIAEMTQGLVKTYPFLSDKEKERFKEEKPVIGKCPRCGANVHESKKNYYCSNRVCAFTMWKNDRFFEERKVAFSPKIAAALLKDGKAKVKKLYSPKTGKTYDGTILLADTGGKYVNYRIAIQRDREVTQQA